MAGINNQPNFKPLFDMQGQAIIDEIQNSKNAIDSTVSTSGDAVLSAISDFNSANVNRINSARDALYGYMSNYRNLTREQIETFELATGQALTGLAAEVEALKAELQLVKNIADFDIRNLTAAKSLQSNGELKRYSINAQPNTINELVYSRGGSGAIVLLTLGNYVSGRVIADGVTFDLGEGINVPAVGFDFIKYMNSISIELSNRHPTSGITCYFSDSEVS